MRFVSDIICLWSSRLSPHNSRGVFSCVQGHTRRVAAGHPRSNEQNRVNEN